MKELTSTAPTLSVADDLILGAGKIAKFIYGDDTPESRRDVYRNPFGFSFFRHGATIAALKSTIRAELIEAQRAAQAERQQKRASERTFVKPRRRRGRHIQQEIGAK